MDPCSFDEATGWAEFTSFESEQSVVSHELNVQQEDIFENCKITEPDACSEITNDDFSTKPCVLDESISNLLKCSFGALEVENSLCDEISTKDGKAKGLEGLAEASSLWQKINDSTEHVCQMIWAQSNLQKNFMKTMDRFLLHEEDQSEQLLPDVLDLSLFIPCFNFHKFVKTKNSQPNNRIKEQLGVNKNPASLLNPFAPDHIKESDRCPSDSSICDTASVSSFDTLSIKEAECSSTTSMESASGGSESNEDFGECSMPASNTTHPILERWKQLQGANDILEAAKAEFSVSELESLLQEIQQSCNRHSATLVKELREKDELLREKQVRDDFISSLLAVSRKQKQHEVSHTSKRKKILSHVFGHVEAKDSKFLDTSIPYFPAENGPSLADIIALTSIFEAILEEDPKVPGMVSNYILNALKQIQLNGGVR